MKWKQFGLVWLSIIFLLSAAKKHIKRTISSKTYQLECKNTNETIHIVLVNATNTMNNDDVIYYIWSAIERPMVLIKHTYTPTVLTIKKQAICDRSNTSKSFIFSPDEGGVSGLIIHKVFPFIDTDDKVSLDLPAQSILQDISKDFTWVYTESIIKDGALFTGKSKVSNGSIIFETVAHSETGHSEPWPHNPVNANLTEFTLTLSDLPAKSPSTRYAAEVLFFSNEGGPNGNFRTTKYIDDEFTPGIFDMWAVSFSHDNVYGTWKPVIYETEKLDDRDRKTQAFATNFVGNAPMQSSGQMPIYDNAKVWTLVSGLPNVKYYGMNLTFGTAKDGFYNKIPHISWIGMVGSGEAPTDVITNMALIVIITGVGIPAVVILAAIFFSLVRKVRLRKSKTYDQIN